MAESDEYYRGVRAAALYIEQRGQVAIEMGRRRLALAQQNSKAGNRVLSVVDAEAASKHYARGRERITLAMDVITNLTPTDQQEKT